MPRRHATAARKAQSGDNLDTPAEPASDGAPKGDGKTGEKRGKDGKDGKDGKGGEKGAEAKGEKGKEEREPEGAKGKKGDGSPKYDCGGGPGKSGKVKRFPPLAPVPIARLGGTRMPRVGEPSTAFRRKSDKIEQATGLTPDEHHDRARAAVLRIERAAHTAQRQIIREVDWLASDTRMTIEGLAAKIPGIVAAAIGFVGLQVHLAKMQIRIGANKQVLRITKHTGTTVENMEKTREKAVIDIMAKLVKGSGLLEEAKTTLESRYVGHQAQAMSLMQKVHPSGVAGQIPIQADPSAKGPKKPKKASAEDNPAKPWTLGEARKKVHAGCDFSAENTDRLRRYQNYWADQWVPKLMAKVTEQYTTGATNRAKKLGSAETKADFLRLSLGLTSPVATEMKNDRPKDVVTENKVVKQEQDAVKAAKDAMIGYIRTSEKGVIARLDHCLFPEIASSLRRAGRQMQRALLAQATVADRGLRTTAADLGASYRAFPRQVARILVPGQPVDYRKVRVPLTRLHRAIKGLRTTQAGMMKKRSEAILTGARRTFRAQVRSLWKGAAGIRKAVAQIVAPTLFDFEFTAATFTGELSADADKTIAEARAYAETVWKTLKERDQNHKDKGTAPLEAMAIGFLNAKINAEQRIYRTMSSKLQSNLEDEEKGPLPAVRKAVESDLEARAKKIQGAIPGRSTTGAVVSTVLGGLVGGLIYAAATSPDMDKIKQALAMKWPGPPALEVVFKGLKGKSLTGYLRDELSGSDEVIALGLLSSDPKVRSLAKILAAKDKINIFGWTVWGPDQETKDAVMASFSPDELKIIDGDPWLKLAKEWLLTDMTGTDLKIGRAYFRGDLGEVLALKLQKKIAKLHSDVDDALFKATDDLHGMVLQELGGSKNAAFVPPDAIDDLRIDALRKHAVLTGQHKGPPSSLTEEEAINLFIGHLSTPKLQFKVTAANVVGGLLLGPLAGPKLEVKKPDESVIRHARNVLTKGHDSDEAKVTRQAHEMKRAEKEGLDETTRMRVTVAFEDPEYARLQRDVKETTDPKKRAELYAKIAEKDKEREKHFSALAKEMGVPAADIEGPGGATKYFENRMGKLFSQEDSLGHKLVGVSGVGTRYGTELIKYGRASLLTATLLATDGWGTDEQLLMHSWRGRSKKEIEAAKQDYKDLRGGDLMVMLGVKKRPRDGWDVAAGLLGGIGGGWLVSSVFRGGELSGDDAFELEKLAAGELVTDKDFAQRAALQYDQERVRGTGWLGRLTLSDHPHTLELDSRRRELGAMLLAAAGMEGDPSAAFDKNGRIRAEVLARAFDENGKFKGDSSALRLKQKQVDFAAEGYRAAMAAMESVFTTLITIAAIIATIVLMLIPGVNIVVAGIIAAVVAGAATIAVKQGMRGERYGYEEMLVDVGMTVVEAMTAGFGGALAGGLGRSGMMVGRLAKVGAAMQKGMGRVGAAMAREAFTGAINSAAAVAMDDATWRDGVGKGLGRVATGAVRGAAVGAVTAGVSEALEGRLRKALTPSSVGKRAATLVEAGDSALMHRAMLIEGVSEAVGAVAGEATGILIDLASGQYKGNLGDALKRLGSAMLRDFVSGAGRGGVMHRNKQRYHRLLGEARSHGDLSGTDVRALRLAAISAGEMGYDGTLRDMTVQVEGGRRLLADFPEGLRKQLGGLDFATLAALHGRLKSGDLGDAQQRLALMRDVMDKLPALDPRAFIRELDVANAAFRAAEVRADVDRKRLNNIRNVLGSKLDGPLRAALRDAPLEGLDKLPTDALRLAAEMVARGAMDGEVAAKLLRIAQDADPDVDPLVFRKNLEEAVARGRYAREVDLASKAKQRAEVVDQLPERSKAIFADLPDTAIRTVSRLFEDGDMGTPQQRESVFRAARKANPDLDRRAFFADLDSAITVIQKRQNAERRERRQARYELLDDLPDPLRGPLSALPDQALFHLRLYQGTGEPLTALQRQQLIDAAVRETPGVDSRQLARVLDEAMALSRGGVEVSATEARKLRGHLEAGVPSDFRHTLGPTPILVFRDAEFAFYARSDSGDAVTVMMGGRPVVVMRQGADPAVALREEGIHVLQARHPDWADRLGALDERKLANWDRLPLEEQLALYRLKVEIEIDAQKQLIAGLERDLSTRPKDAGLRAQLERTQRALANLEHRLVEVDAIGPLHQLAIKRGVDSRPKWLDQPARLFSKDGDDLRTGLEVEGFTRVSELENKLREHWPEAELPLLVAKLHNSDDRAALQNELIRLLRTDDGPKLKTEIWFALDSPHATEALTGLRLLGAERAKAFAVEGARIGDPNSALVAVARIWGLDALQPLARLDASRETFALLRTAVAMAEATRGLPHATRDDLLTRLVAAAADNPAEGQKALGTFIGILQRYGARKVVTDLLAAALLPKEMGLRRLGIDNLKSLALVPPDGADDVKISDARLEGLAAVLSDPALDPIAHGWALRLALQDSREPMRRNAAEIMASDSLRALFATDPEVARAFKLPAPDFAMWLRSADLDLAPQLAQIRKTMGESEATELLRRATQTDPPDLALVRTAGELLTKAPLKSLEQLLLLDTKDPVAFARHLIAIADNPDLGPDALKEITRLVGRANLTADQWSTLAEQIATGAVKPAEFAKQHPDITKKDKALLALEWLLIRLESPKPVDMVTPRLRTEVKAELEAARLTTDDDAVDFVARHQERYPTSTATLAQLVRMHENGWRIKDDGTRAEPVSENVTTHLGGEQFKWAISADATVKGAAGTDQASALQVELATLRDTMEKAVGTTFRGNFQAAALTFHLSDAAGGNGQVVHTMLTISKDGVSYPVVLVSGSKQLGGKPYFQDFGDAGVTIRGQTFHGAFLVDLDMLALGALMASGFAKPETVEEWTRLTQNVGPNPQAQLHTERGETILLAATLQQTLEAVKKHAQTGDLADPKITFVSPAKSSTFTSCYACASAMFDWANIPRTGLKLADDTDIAGERGVRRMLPQDTPLAHRTSAEHQYAASKSPTKDDIIADARRVVDTLRGDLTDKVLSPNIFTDEGLLRHLATLSHITDPEQLRVALIEYLDNQRRMGETGSPKKSQFEHDIDALRAVLDPLEAAKVAREAAGERLTSDEEAALSAARAAYTQAVREHERLRAFKDWLEKMKKTPKLLDVLLQPLAAPGADTNLLLIDIVVDPPDNP